MTLRHAFTPLLEPTYDEGYAMVTGIDADIISHYYERFLLSVTYAGALQIITLTPAP